jgi:catechol 2,3-dioxygenase-like lactoylglutathione lyase family enzyme
MTVRIEKLSAITLKVADMDVSVRFYRDVLGMELVCGVKDAYFSLLHMADTQLPILNLEQGTPIPRWGRIIFHVADVDAFWTLLKDRGSNPERPQDACWGERYFHMLNPQRLVESAVGRRPASHVDSFCAAIFWQ